MASPVSLLSLSLSLLVLLLPPSLASDPRLSELLALRARSSDGVIRIDDNTFRRFILSSDSSPSPSLSFILFFDAKDLREQNPDLQLDALRLDFGLVSKAYWKTNLKDSKSPSDEEGDKRKPWLFFCELEFRHAQSAFRHYKVEALPHIRFVPSSQKSEEMKPDQFPRTADGIASFVTAKSGVSVGTIERPPLLAPWQMVVLGALTVSTVPFAVKYFLTHRTLVHEAWVWCLMGLFIFFFSISGGMFNIIRSMPMYVRDRQNPNKFNYWYHGSGAQFGVEGFCVGGLYTLVGLLLALITFYLPRMGTNAAQRLVVYFCFFVGAAAVRQVALLDQWKTGYQIHAFFPKSWR